MHKFKVATAILLLLTTICEGANDACYEIDFSLYGPNNSMRRETVYQLLNDGRVPIQTRIYEHKKNELREAAFLQENGNWRVYGDTNLPTELKISLQEINATSPKRSLVPELKHPVTPMERYEPGSFGNPFKAEKSRIKKCDPTTPTQKSKFDAVQIR